MPKAKAAPPAKKRGPYKKKVIVESTRSKRKEPTGEGSIFEMHDGAPIVKGMLTEFETKAITNALELLIPGKRYTTMPVRYKNHVKKIADERFPSFKLRISSPKDTDRITIQRLA